MGLCWGRIWSCTLRGCPGGCSSSTSWNQVKCTPVLFIGCKRSWQSSELGTHPSDIKGRTNVSQLKQFAAFFSRKPVSQSKSSHGLVGVFFHKKSITCLYIAFAKWLVLKKNCSIISCIIKNIFLWAAEPGFLRFWCLMVGLCCI